MRDEKKIIEFESVKEKHIDNDSKEEGNLRYGIYKQPLDDGMLAWRIEGLYKKDDFSTKNVLTLKKEPPILILEDNNGNKAKFTLTKNVSQDLEKSLRVLNKAYNGQKNKKKIKIEDLKNIKNNWRQWPIDTVLFFVAIVLFIITLILQ